MEISINYKSIRLKSGVQPTDLKFGTVKLHHILNHVAKFQSSTMFPSWFSKVPKLAPPFLRYFLPNWKHCHNSENEPGDLKFCIVKLHHILHHVAKFGGSTWFLNLFLKVMTKSKLSMEKSEMILNSPMKCGEFKLFELFWFWFNFEIEMEMNEI